MTKYGARWYTAIRRTLLHKRRLATPLRKGVMRMGNGRGAKVLRYIVCFIIALALMLLTAQKAC